MNIELELKTALSELKTDLKQGDEVITETTGSGKQISHSKKVGEHRIRFMNKIMDKMKSCEITAAEATKATQLFGKKTTSIYWIKG